MGDDSGSEYEKDDENGGSDNFESEGANSMTSSIPSEWYQRDGDDDEGGFDRGSATEAHGVAASASSVCARMELRFKIWKEFDEALKVYEAETQQHCRLRTSVSVQDRNRDRMKKYNESTSKKKKQPVMFDECQETYYRKYICTHGWPDLQRIPKVGALRNAFTETSIVNNYIPYSTTRLNIPFYDLIDPRPIISKPIKTVRYLNCFAQYFKEKAGMGVQCDQQNASFNFQLSASLKKFKYIAMIPFAETSSGH